jgi:hypothetical protein
VSPAQAAYAERMVAHNTPCTRQIRPLCVQEPAPDLMHTPGRRRVLARRRRLLLAAYERPCFACGRKGDCSHREPRIELLLAFQGLRAAMRAEQRNAPMARGRG